MNKCLQSWMAPRARCTQSNPMHICSDQRGSTRAISDSKHSPGRRRKKKWGDEERLREKVQTSSHRRLGVTAHSTLPAMRQRSMILISLTLFIGSSAPFCCVQTDPPAYVNACVYTTRDTWHVSPLTLCATPRLAALKKSALQIM